MRKGEYGTKDELCEGDQRTCWFVLDTEAIKYWDVFLGCLPAVGCSLEKTQG